MPLLPRPTPNSVRTLHSKLLDDWSESLSHREEIRDLIRGTNKIETLEDSPDRNMRPIEIHGRRAGGILEHANGLIMAPPKFHAEPIDLFAENKIIAEQVEKICKTFFERQLIANDFWPSIGRDVLGYGMAFAKTMLSLSEWTPQAGYPVRGKNESAKAYLDKIRKWKETEGKFPFIIKHIPVNDILAHLDNDNNVLATIEPKWIAANVLANDMKSAEVAELLNRGTLNWFDELLVIEYIDSEWVGYFLAGTLPRNRTEEDLKRKLLPSGYTELRVWEHKLGKHPVVLFPGITTKDSELKYRFKSFLDDAKEALETYDFIVSRLACADADEKILIASGEEFTYGELAKLNKSFEVITPQGRGGKGAQRGKALAKAYFSGDDDIYEVELESGIKLCRNSHHKLATPLETRNTRGGRYSTKLDFKNVSDLRPGDFVVVMNRFDSVPAAKKEPVWITPNIALIIGAILGDGHVADNNVANFVCFNEEQVKLYTKTLEEIGQRFSIYKIKNSVGNSIQVLNGREGNKYQTRAKRAPVLNALRNLGLVGKNSRTKSLYDETRMWPKRIVSQILRGLLLTDGHIKKSNGSLHYSSRSKNLRDWVAFVAHRLGCPGKSWESYRNGDEPQYEWSAYTEFVFDFVSKIGGLPGKINQESLHYVDKANPGRGIRKLKKPYSRMHKQQIKSINYIGRKPIVCIEVLEGDSHIYVANNVVEHNTMIWAYYLPSYIWKLPQQSTAFVGKERPTMTVKLGGVTPLYGDEQLLELPVPKELQYATLLLGQVEDLIQRHALEDVLFGRVAGSAPAYQVNLRINVARSKLSPIAQHMAIGISRIIELFFRGVEQLGEAVSIGGEKITVKMAKQYRERVTASITPKSPIDRNQDIGVANMALEFGLPWDWIVENILDIEDPATLKLMSDIRKLEDSPSVQERVLKDAMERLELLIEEEDFTSLDNIDLSQLPPEAADALNELVGESTQEGLGRGPFPSGASPQTIQGGRGLSTPKRQPLPGIVTENEANMGAF